MAEPPQCLTGPLRRCLLGILYLALRSFPFLFTELTAYKIYRSIDTSSLTPTWNPPEDQPLATSSRIVGKQPDGPQHHLLDERLVGTRLKVVVNNPDTGKNSEGTVRISKVDGVVSSASRSGSLNRNGTENRFERTNSPGPYNFFEKDRKRPRS